VVIFQRPAWWASARCRGLGVALFFGVEGTETVTARRRREQEAKAVCASCSVKIECLADALKFNDEGVRGGLTKYERQQRAPLEIIEGSWVLIAQSAGLRGKSRLERFNSSKETKPVQYRVVVDDRVLKLTGDETEAWIALHNSDL